MNDAIPPSLPNPGPEESPLSRETREVKSDELLQGQRELLIQHDGETYRLRLTRNGKLILHK